MTSEGKSGRHSWAKAELCHGVIPRNSVVATTRVLAPKPNNRMSALNAAHESWQSLRFRLDAAEPSRQSTRRKMADNEYASVFVPSDIIFRNLTNVAYLQLSDHAPPPYGPPCLHHLRRLLRSSGSGS